MFMKPYHFSALSLKLANDLKSFTGLLRGRRNAWSRLREKRGKAGGSLKFYILVRSAELPSPLNYYKLLLLFNKRKDVSQS
ncbi:Thump Domain-Containing Protein 3 [Manis pentadactyla]|nr:Thump Domain-Containing Protein 3 [Manis pentadactyla]